MATAAVDVVRKAPGARELDRVMRGPIDLLTATAERGEVQAKAMRQNLEATAKALGLLTAVLERVNSASRGVNSVIFPEPMSRPTSDRPPAVTAREMSVADAAALLRSDDTLALPLGPGAPTALLHALGDRDDWTSLQVFGALLLDLYAVFMKPGVHLRSGFFGPAERALRDAGANVEYIPADFRRFVTIAEQFAPRVMTTAAAPPDEHGFMSLALHAGATVAELQRAAADPDRLVIVEVNDQLPRTLGIPPEYPHALHVDAVDVIVRESRPVYVLADDAAE